MCLMLLSFLWICAIVLVLLGVLDQRVNERTFQAKMERRLALLVGEGLGIGVSSRRWRRATSVRNNSVQVHSNTLVYTVCLSFPHIIYAQTLVCLRSCDRPVWMARTTPWSWCILWKRGQERGCQLRPLRPCSTDWTCREPPSYWATECMGF